MTKFLNKIVNGDSLEILKKVQYDTFYHEHLRTYSLISLEYLFNKNYQSKNNMIEFGFATNLYPTP